MSMTMRVIVMLSSLAIGLAPAFAQAPAAIPGLITGAKLAVAVSAIAAVLAEQSFRAAVDLKPSAYNLDRLGYALGEFLVFGPVRDHLGNWAVTMFQINADAVQNGLTVVPAARAQQALERM